MRINPSERFQEMPCSYVSTATAYENLTGLPFVGPMPEGLHNDGYLPLYEMNQYFREWLPIKRKIYYNKKRRMTLQQYLERQNKPCLICVLGHCVYAVNGDYVSFFDNDNDLVVCVWELNNTKE